MGGFGPKMIEVGKAWAYNLRPVPGLSPNMAKIGPDPCLTWLKNTPTIEFVFFFWWKLQQSTIELTTKQERQMVVLLTMNGEEGGEREPEQTSQLAPKGG